MTFLSVLRLTTPQEEGARQAAQLESDLLLGLSCLALIWALAFWWVCHQKKNRQDGR